MSHETELPIAEAAEHIERLIGELRARKFPDPDDFHVYWINNRDEAIAIADSFPVEVHLPRVRSLEDYATALHELGHICGRYQKSTNILTRERWAWAWAKQTALRWTATMERDAQSSLKGYKELVRPRSHR
jgi:hypothetical protein